MTTITETVAIDRPVEQVFAFISNYANDCLWRSGVIEMKQAEPTRLGMTTKETIRFAGRQMTTIGLVTEFIPNKKISFRSISGAILVTGYRQLQLRDGRTLVTYSLSAQLLGIHGLLSPVVVYSFRRRVAGDLERLKAVLEACTHPLHRTFAGCVQ